MLQNKKELIKLFLALIIIGAFYTIVGCPIKFLTGLSCPGCGMTRAYLSLLKLDFPSAFHFHPLWLIPILFLINYFYIKKKNILIYKIINYIFISLFILVYIIRIISVSDIVTLDFKEGLIYKLLIKIIKWLFKNLF